MLFRCDDGETTDINYNSMKNKQQTAWKNKNGQTDSWAKILSLGPTQIAWDKCNLNTWDRIWTIWDIKILRVWDIFYVWQHFWAPVPKTFALW